ncbi:hypothetical protein BHF68_07350 [Desulfuribacillus alkaliarsenatis]|uniref:UspA domain-containing protein n=2 Tax=Desulfuribacillus alkaliarsenatis TaxID=766136 RepID=A0A1E5G0M2_9FIRM|nr:hypothetical protein BHF68_07350 [Desulfuribacillus alkaliarsenatis]
MLIEKVLIGTDYSAPAEQLYDCLSELKKQGLKRVILIHVIDIQSAGGNAAELQVFNEKKLTEKKHELEKYGLEVITKAPIGFPPYEITMVAKEENASLILVGSHGKGIIKNIFIGSTTFDLLRTAKTPVLIEKYQDVGAGNCKPYCTIKFNKVLIPTDFSDASLAMITQLKGTKGMEEVIFATVIEKSKNTDELESKKAEFAEKLAILKQEFADAGYKTNSLLKEGNAANAILQIAEEEQVTLIALAKRGQGRIAELLLGSVAEAVAKQSKAPVLLFPSR